MIWIELSTRAEAEAVEAVAALFSELGHGGGVAIEEPLVEGAEPGQAQSDPTRPVLVKTYIPEDEQAPGRIRRAEEALWHLSQLRRIEPLATSRLAEEDWAEAWKSFFFPQRVGERLVIKPSWRDYLAGPNEVVLEIDPGMAFGTGLHPTTRMCLRACERHVREGSRVLDVGTGSGVLAMAAARLGADRVLALDVDPVAVEAARKNVAANGLENRIQVLHGSVGPDSPVRPGSFDLVLANLIARLIVDLAPDLAEALAPGGLTVASGIIADREAEAREALEAVGFEISETVAEGDWRTLVGRRGRA